MKRIFTDLEIYLEDRDYISEEDYPKIFDILDAGIVPATGVLKCDKSRNVYTCSIDSKEYPAFPLKNKKIDVIDMEGFIVNSPSEATVTFNSDAICGLITPSKGRVMEGKNVLVCKVFDANEIL